MTRSRFWRKRRLMLSTWRRLTRWEFWPVWQLYFPIFFNILYLGLKYRSWTLFTVVNPSMPASGFIGDRKDIILEQLAGAGDHLARWMLLEANRGPEDALSQVRIFQKQYSLDFPLVLKPNEGQRGMGVLVAHTESDVRQYILEAFTDGNALITPKLTRKIDEISRHCEGFYFGRYDVRVPSEKDLKEGQNFKILELNGVTSEATGMYDPKNSVFHAWKTLVHQWQVAFEVGNQNRARGHHPMNLRDLIRYTRSTINRQKGYL